MNEYTFIMLPVIMGIGIGILLLVAYAIYKALRNRKELGNMYTPYDDMVRGTTDVNTSKFPAKDTKHAIPFEESQKVERDGKGQKLFGPFFVHSFMSYT